jgi:hypothetical protein
MSSARPPKHIPGSIYSQIRRIFELVLQRIEKREIPINGLVAAQTFYQYPVTCLREIIANALVHRRYDDTDRMIHIRAFSDRIEVVSPGSWSAGKKLSEMPIGLSSEGESVKRNFRLVQAISAIKLVEGEGSGIPTGLRDCSESDAPEPTVAEKDGCVVVTVFPRRDWSQFVKNNGAARRVVNLPYESLGPLLKGRDRTLAELRQRLGFDGESALGFNARQAIYGLSGVGKTRLAVEYAWRHAGDYTALLFAGASSASDLRTNLANFCGAPVLNLPERGRSEEKLAAVFHWLSQNPGWLLILDNADTQEAATEVGARCRNFGAEM